MSDTTDTPTPAETYYTIASIKRGPGELWRVIVIDTDGHQHGFTVATSQLNLTTIRLSAFVCSQLWQTKNGATPLAALT